MVETFDLDVEDVLRKLLSGKLTVEQAKRRLAAINVKRIADLARLDIRRALRVGVPEAILAEGKNPKDSARAAIAMARETG
ncbi:MAG: hypothetical protein NZ934_00825, partial [Hadesarchaea archaeon]|nr:hypothetical protein [Hadesarchaea archaeon]